MINDRKLEKTSLNGYMIYIRYNGNEYDCFDENPGFKSVKSEFKKRFEENGINIFKGIQQAGRTDKGVSANENVLYIMTSKINIDEMLKYDDVIKIQRVLPFLEFPDYVEKREYIFKYDVEKITRSEDEIQKLCKNLSGNMDYSRFTTKKGRQIKNTVRNLKIEYKDNSLYFLGDSFLPHQVRIMSSYILTGKMKELDGKYLCLNKIFFNKVIKGMFLVDAMVDIPDVKFAVECEKYIFLYTDDISKSIGRNGKNIKKINLKKKAIYRRI